MLSATFKMLWLVHTIITKFIVIKNFLGVIYFN